MQEAFGLDNVKPAPRRKPEREEFDFSVDPFFSSSQRAKKHGDNGVTVLAAGSVFEGTLHTKGDVELNGEFKGDVFADGNVTIHTDIEGNVQAENIELDSCSIKGDLTAASMLKMSENSVVTGNLHVNSIDCSGQIEGNVEAEGSVALKSTARLNGDLSAADISVESGAVISGRMSIAAR